MATDFVNYIQGMDLGNKLISLIISRAFFNLIQSLIAQFITPPIKSYLIPTKTIKGKAQTQEFEWFGRKIDTSDLIDKSIMLVVSLINVWIIFRIFLSE
jgi:large-conductance mechanosensitive channel